jgi:glycogen debranching enzyme
MSLASSTRTGLRPLLHDSVVALRAPTQVWSGQGGDMGGDAVHGIYHGDTRFISDVALTYDGHTPEWISVSAHNASHVTFGGLLREIDNDLSDPLIRVSRDRVVTAGEVRERLSIVSIAPHVVETTLRLRLVPDFSPLDEVKGGSAAALTWTHFRPSGIRVSDSVTVACERQSLTVTAPGGAIDVAEDALTVEWHVCVEPRERVDVGCVVALADDSLVVAGVTRPTDWSADIDAIALRADPRLGRWLDSALEDLDALRLSLPEHPEDEFFAAGAPWFFTLFGRDSLWAARLVLPIDHRVAASTLRVLARLQGHKVDSESAEEPGKIPHELRSSGFAIPAEGLALPPVYYGTVDATALWVTLLAEAWEWGMPDDEVRALVPALRGALGWIVNHGDNDGDGFIDYIDLTGHGLSNHGWKDSDDSIQWRAGELADGPIALCEVQGYAYEAALAGARVFDRLGEAGGAELREWAAALKARFAASYWVVTPEGRYPAVALDARKCGVDSLTSNIGHLIGTGILEPEEEAHVASLLVGPSMLSGFGVRTMSTEAVGYWPLSYHGGSVWTHDSAIIARGMARAGLFAEADAVVGGLLAAAEGFGYRMPELHSGDSADENSTPTPYPAACRPQAWSAAAAVTVAHVMMRRGAYEPL